MLYNISYGAERSAPTVVHSSVLRPTSPVQNSSLPEHYTPSTFKPNRKEDTLDETTE